MKHTILLADDSVTIQKVVELTFMDEDVRVVSVGNGSDALARLDDVRPDVILADVHMPGADGYEVCLTARRRQPGVPVLLLVGTFEIFDPERAAEVGASGHLKKPFDSQELLRRVRELLAAGRTAAPAAAPALTEPALPAVQFEPPAWEPEPPSTPAASEETFERAAEGSAVGGTATVAGTAADEVESWSFEPVGEPEAALAPSAPEPAPAAAAAESWGGFATTRFEAAASTVSFASEPAPVAPAGAAAPPAAAVSAASPSPSGAAAPALSDADLERLARRVAELLSERAVKDVAWEVVPDLAEVLLKARIRELEAAVE